MQEVQVLNIQRLRAADRTKIEAVDPAEGARWLERLRAGEHEDGAFVDQLAEAARDCAQRALADAPERLRTGSDEQVRLQGTLTALHLLSTVPLEESTRWFTDLARRITPDGPDREAERRRRELSAFSNATAQRLQRVVAGPQERRAGLQIVCVELYEDCLAVQWHSVGDGDPWPPRATRGDPAVAVRDDRDTEYVGRAGGGSLLGHSDDRPGSAVRGSDMFVPAVPADARTLTVSYEDEPFVVQL